MSKRRRVSAGRAASRPIDKVIRVIAQTGVDTTQQNTVILTAAAACTMTGLLWDFTFAGDAGTVGSDHDYRWAIIRAREGATLDNLTTTDAATLYTPEQDVIAWGFGIDLHHSGTIIALTSANHWTGKTKIKRKLMIGDRIMFISRGIATETVRVLGAVQLFCQF